MDADTEYEHAESSDLRSLQILEGLEKAAWEFIEELKSDTCYPRIRHRIPKHIAAIENVAKMCRNAIEGFGLWREDGLDFDEVCEEIADQVERIEEELENADASSLTLDSHELAECQAVASTVLAFEEHLSGAELGILDDLVQGEILDTRRLLQIAGNHRLWFKIMDQPSSP